MHTHRTNVFPLLWSLVIILALSGLSIDGSAQTVEFSYPDKLFGGRYTFTPSADEIMVRLADRSDRRALVADAELLAANQNLDIVRAEGIETQRFVVLRVGADRSVSAALGALRGHPDVARAYPALLNDDGTNRYFLPDQVVVQFDPGLSETGMLTAISRLGSEIVIDHWTPGFYTVSVPAGRDVFDHVRAFIDLPDVQFAELSTLSFNDESYVPNDPLYANQWGMKNTGAGFYTNDADGDVEEAWDIERGNPNVIVAVIDTGVDWDHPDLQPNILQNLGEDADNDGQTMIWNGANWVMDPGDLNGIDNDGNGRIDDLFGWDFRSNDNNPNPTTSAHGTACAGLVAATGNNSTGVAGVAHNCRIMPLRVNLSSGVNQNRADAINYAVGEAGNYAAMVVSCSWICSSGSTISVQNAVINARNAGVLPVFAAGNANGAVNFPASLNAAMAIAATSPCDERKNPASCDGENNWGSNFGNPLSIGAPGVLMQTTDIAGAGGYTGGNYTATFNGTSSACPFTAGAVALLHSEAIELTGTALTPNDAQRLLEDSAEQVGGYAYPGGFSQQLGNGRINVNLALQLLVAENLVELLPPPVDVALSIDRSFSMVGDNILAAENAAAQVVRLLDVGDRIAVTSYSGGADPGGLPDWPAWTDFATIEIINEGTKNAAIAAIETGGDVYNLTAIGEGMKKARNELFAAIPAQYPQSIILLSDGINTDGPDPLSILPLPAPQPKIFTIGFGSFADELTLQGIATATGGQYFFAGTSGSKVTGGILPLIQTYQLSLLNATERQALDWINGQMRVPGEDRYEFLVDTSVDQILISLLWGYLDPEAFFLLLVDPAGNTYDMSSDEWVGDETVSAYRINRPEPGNWLALVIREGQGEGSGYYHLNLACSSRVQSSLSLVSHGFGEPMLAKLRLVQLMGDVGVAPIRGADVPAVLTFPNGETTQLLLNDQGFDGDETPDDGIYCATIQNTFGNGSYVVETTAFGQTLDNFPFTRYDLATAVLNREEEPAPPLFILPHIQELTGLVVELPILVTQWVDPWDIVQLELGFVYDPEVIQFVGFEQQNGTMMENWFAEVEDLGDAVILHGEGEPLHGEGLLARLQFKMVGELGATTPLAFNLMELRDSSGNNVPAEGNTGSATVGSPLPDRTPVLYPVFSGWSLRSLPVVLAPDETLEEQLPGIQEALLWQNEEYSPTDNPGAGDGLWMFYGGPDTNELLIGDALGSYSRIYPAGWALLGGLFDESVVPVVEPASAEASMFRYLPDRGYLPAVQIDPGQGVWFHAAVPFTVTVDANVEKWVPTGEKDLAQAELTATGEQVEGVPSVNHVVIGGGVSESVQQPYPPAPPAYTTLLRLLDTADPTWHLYSDIRTEDAIDDGGVVWFLDLRPGGNTGGSGTTIGWSPDALRQIADVTWRLHEGLGTAGPVVVDDMRDVGAFSVAGSDQQQFTIAIGGISPVDDEVMPKAFALRGNHPNPFNPMTTIRYEVPKAGHVRIDVFDLRGLRVATLVDRVVQPGSHSVVWDGRDRGGANLPSGEYFSRLTADGVSFTGRMTLLK